MNLHWVKFYLRSKHLFLSSRPRLMLFSPSMNHRFPVAVLPHTMDMKTLYAYILFRPGLHVVGVLQKKKDIVTLPMGAAVLKPCKPQLLLPCRYLAHETSGILHLIQDK